MINFRDFGGQTTNDGLRVVRDHLYRCGHLADLEEAQAVQLISLDFGVIADLRNPRERERQCSPWPVRYIARVIAHHNPMNTSAPHLEMLKNGTLTVSAVDDFYLRFYRELPFDFHYQLLFAEILRRIANEQSRVLVHCSAGKDRTGMICALLLNCIGVPREAILDDYLRSSRAPGLLAMIPGIIESTHRRYGHSIPEEAVNKLLDVNPTYLNAMFDAIENRSGSFDAYLKQIGVREAVVEKLRERLLDNAGRDQDL